MYRSARSISLPGSPAHHHSPRSLHRPAQGRLRHAARLQSGNRHRFPVCRKEVRLSQLQPHHNGNPQTKRAAHQPPMERST
ncbi:hypothetical protein AAFF_G00278010 [Aldrovandia affinis]|uniref:Uncharacterized protein n=1 Tax=Aldrovandia affinis TaxID=143900 RepID=A0AAD7SS76_9TELE|nr:hypothetical protein AAFF_G00278010 [Aldrovandia affinis]